VLVCRSEGSGISGEDLRMLELELVFDLDVLGAFVLELMDEIVRFFLRFTICFQGPALSDLEDLE
jgi:hypothetical protein